MTRSIQSCLTLMVAMLCFGLANAQSFMTFYDTQQGAMASWHLQDVRKVTFVGEEIVVDATMGNTAFALSDVMSIKFNDVAPQPTAVTNILSDVSPLSIATTQDAIRVIGAQRGTVSIWAVNGQQLYNNRNWQGEEINIAHLQRGIYLITINQTTFKFKK